MKLSKAIKNEKEKRDKIYTDAMKVCSYLDAEFHVETFRDVEYVSRVLAKVNKVSHGLMKMRDTETDDE